MARKKIAKNEEKVESKEANKENRGEKTMEKTTEKVNKSNNRGIGKYANQLLLEVIDKEEFIGRPYDEILKMVQEKFPGCNTSLKCLRWYNNKLQKDHKVPARPRIQTIVRRKTEEEKYEDLKKRVENSWMNLAS